MSTSSLRADSQSIGVAWETYATGFASSKDGTPIGYRQLGRGPAVVVLHGAMESAQSHMQLAEALADTFTVCLPDRRGRGLSGPYAADYSVQSDVEDLDAVLTASGAHSVFGVSSGGIISLQAALTLPMIRKLAVYEPPLFPDGAAPTAWLTRYDAEMAQGKVAAALVTGMKASQMGPRIFDVIPRWLLERMTDTMMSGEERKAGPDSVTWRSLAPTLGYDGRLVAEMSGRLEGLRAIRSEVLLLGGSRSPAFLKSALDGLEKALPRARRIEFPGLGHGGSGNRDRGGRPEQLAQELRRFFA
jgi:pimeloyl-ACP methyl ester carboxylesterase